MTEGNFPAASVSKSSGVDFDAMLKDEGPKIYTLAVRLTGNATDGQDLAQETFINAYKNLSRFRGEAAIGTWLYRICLNVWKNRVKYEKRRFFWRHFSLSAPAADDKPVFELPEPGGAAEKPLEESERRRVLQSCLMKLEAVDRGVLLLRDQEDKSYEEIASLLDMPLGTVKSRLFRAREKLKVLLTPFFEDLI